MAQTTFTWSSKWDHGDVTGATKTATERRFKSRFRECEMDPHFNKICYRRPIPSLSPWGGARLAPAWWQTHRGRHVHCVMEIGLITDKSYGGAAKRLQLPPQCNVITAEEVEDGDGKAERKDADHHWGHLLSSGRGGCCWSQPLY